MKGIKAIFAGIGALSLASLGVFGGGGASAASAVRLTDNPDSATSIQMKHVIKNGLVPITARFGYFLQACGTLPDLNSPSPIVGEFVFNNAAPDGNYEMEATSSIDLSNMSFGAAGTYEFCLRENSYSTEQDIINDELTRYKVIVDVVNERNERGEYTGNLKATLIPQALNLITGEKGEVVFESEPNLTYVEISHEVLGDKANFDQYFRYYINPDKTRILPTGTELPISGIDEYYIDPATGEQRRNITSLKTDSMNFVYLKKDQVLTIGVENGKNRLPKEMVYEFSLANSSDNERLYSIKINEDNTGLTSITNRTELVPGDDASEAELAQFDSMNKIAVKRMIASGVSTGLTTKLMPFVVIAVMSLVAACGIKIYSSRLKKNRVTKD